jgi:hypothetical protein
MVVYVILGIALAVGAYLLLQGFVRASPHGIAQTIRIGGVIIGAIIVVLLAASGRLAWLIYLLPALLPWLLAARGIWRTAKQRRGPRKGQTSNVETSSISMTLDHDTGEMDGTVLAGPMQGMQLSAMTRDQLIQLYRWCAASDIDAARLLEAYLDRVAGAEWRQTTEGAGTGDAPPHEGTMSKEEAYSVLGLAPGADADAIRAAHRRMMQQVHPDRGGSAYLAAKINAARDVLLGSS